MLEVGGTKRISGYVVGKCKFRVFCGLQQHFFAEAARPGRRFPGAGLRRRNPIRRIRRRAEARRCREENQGAAVQEKKASPLPRQPDGLEAAVACLALPACVTGAREQLQAVA